jgi:putative ABC transport system permease protein
LFVYLANSLIAGDDTTPYSFVAALKGGPDRLMPKPGEMIVTDWLAEDLALNKGDSITMSYFVMGPLRRLKEARHRFLIASVVPLSDIPFGPSMMPDFPGMSDAGSCRHWETGAPVDLSRIRDKDENYWNQYKGTPKAFVSMEDGARIWQNPYGLVTAIRFNNVHQSIGRDAERLMQFIDPETVGLSWIPVYEEGKQAAKNSVDFGELFLSLSFFLIVASLLLTGLLFGDYLRVRMSDMPLLVSLGFHKKQIIGIFFRESILIALAGTILGICFGILVNEGILMGLNTLWNEAVPSASLHSYIQTNTLVTGGLTGLLLILIILIINIIRRVNKPVTVLFRIQTQWLRLQKSGSRWTWKAGLFILILVLGFTVYLVVTNNTDQSTWFLGLGAMTLFGGWLVIQGWFARNAASGKIHSFSRDWLRNRNLGLFRKRHLVAVLLMALGTFVIVITGANRKTFFGTEESRSSGTGGFLYWGETTHPVLLDLNQPEGKKAFLLEDEPSMTSVQFVQFHLLEGNDASCLNLNQVSSPKILGVPADALDRREAFAFSTLAEGVDAQHPWRELTKQFGPSTYPAFADQTVITWGLMKKVGDTLHYVDESGKPFHLILRGGLQSSVFQGHLLVSDQVFKKRYPSVSGSKVLLVEGDQNLQDAIARSLEARFPDYGIFLTRASQRLADFYSVTNTYLSIFMLMGALGVLIGTIGFGVVIYQNILQRKQELALYIALGFSGTRIYRMMVREFLLVLLCGMGLGILGAFIGLLPSLFSFAYEIPLLFILLMLLILFLHGWLWVVIPVRVAMRQALIPTLKQE